MNVMPTLGKKPTARQRLAQAAKDYIENWKRHPHTSALSLLQSVFAFLCAALLGSGQLPYGVYPFGIAFFAVQTKRAPFAFAGLLLSAFYTENLGIATAIASVTMLALRYCLHFVKDENGKTRPLFAEPFLMRLPVALCGAMLVSWYRILAGGFASYDFSGAFFLVVATAFAAVAYACADGCLHFHYAKDIGNLSLAVSLIYVLRDTWWLGMSVGAVVAWTCTLYTAYRQGGAKGCVCGTACGLAVSVAATPAYAIGALLFGVLRPLSLALAVAWCAAGAGVYLLFAQSLLAVYAALPDFVMAVGLTLLITHLVKEEREQNAGEGVIADVRAADSHRRVQSLSLALAELSKAFSHLSRRLKKPTAYEVGAICDETMRKICTTCPERVACEAGCPANFMQTVQDVTCQMTQEGHIELNTAPKVLVRNCAQLRNVVGALNDAYGKKRKETMEESGTDVVADDYAGLAQLLQQALHGEEEEYTLDAERTAEVNRQAKKIGFCASDMAVCGTRAVQVLASGVEQASVTGEKLQKVVEKTLGLPFHPPTFSVMGSGEVQMKMARRPVVSAQASSANCAKKGESVSGDVITSFQTDRDMFYTLLSDGMGSGPDAAMSAGICRVFLEKMLTCGNSRSISMEMLNDLIRNKSDENFATVDLLEVDLLCKEARFLKSGAAPSFVLRGGNLFKIAANTVPVGVMKSLQAEEIKFRLEDNDVILMFSDGIAQSFEDSLWLLGVVTCEWEDDLDAMAKKILERAKIQNGTDDDMTIALVRIQSLEEAKIPA